MAEMSPLSPHPTSSGSHHHEDMSTKDYFWSIPPIQDAILSNLAQEDAKACALVCKEWATIFMPAAWHHVKYPIPGAHWPLGIKSLVYRNYHTHVRSIAIVGTLPDFTHSSDLPLYFPNLASLDVMLSDFVAVRAPSLPAFVAARPLLRVLKIRGMEVSPKETLDEFCRVIRHHPALEELELHCNILITRAATITILQSSSRLKRIRLHCPTNMEFSAHYLHDMASFEETCLRTLELPLSFPRTQEWMDELVLEFLRYCPKLERLALHRMFDEDSHADALLRTLERYCPLLVSLKWKGYEYDSRNHAGVLLRGLTNLKEIEYTMPYCWNNDVLRDVLGHQTTLMHLHLMSGTPLHYAGLVDIMASCPKLQSLKVKVTLSGRAHQQRLVERPCVCVGLTELSLDLYRIGRRSRYSLVFLELCERLGTLHRLSKLEFCGQRHTDVHEGVVSLGLQKLKQLRRLVHFEYDSKSDEVVREEDVELMLGQWPRIQSLNLKNFAELSQSCRERMCLLYPTVLLNGAKM